MRLNDFPSELLGKIFGYLTVPDILGLKLVNCTFRDVVSDHPYLQYRCELVAAGLLDNPDGPGTLFDRRILLHKYRSRFDGLKSITKSSLPLGTVGTFCGYRTSGGLYVTNVIGQRVFHFCRPPSVSGRQPIKTWSFPLPFSPGSFVIHPPLDLVVTSDNVSRRLHFTSMTTGGPHPLAFNPWIQHNLWPTEFRSFQRLTISISDRVVSAQIWNRLVVWNWRTGDKIIDRKDLRKCSMAFIGEDRLLLSEGLEPSPDAVEIPYLVLLDTSVPATPSSVPSDVHFVCDPRYHGMRVRVEAEDAGWSDLSGVIGQDTPYYPDPSKRILALVFHLGAGKSTKGQGVCLVHSEALLSLAREKGGGIVEWDAWEKFTFTPDMDEDLDPNVSPKYSVSGSRFVMVGINEIERWAKIKVYDLAHWSRQHRDAGLGGDERKVPCFLTETVLELPDGMWSIIRAPLVQDSIVFFHFDRRRAVPNQQSQGSLSIWSF